MRLVTSHCAVFQMPLKCVFEICARAFDVFSFCARATWDRQAARAYGGETSDAEADGTTKAGDGTIYHNNEKAKNALGLDDKKLA